LIFVNEFSLYSIIILLLHILDAAFLLFCRIGIADTLLDCAGVEAQESAARRSPWLLSLFFLSLNNSTHFLAGLRRVTKTHLLDGDECCICLERFVLGKVVAELNCEVGWNWNQGFGSGFTGFLGMVRILHGTKKNYKLFMVD
jgi:hypothetical protein